MKKVLFSLAAIAFLVTGTSMATNIAVTGAAALEGSYGLAVNMDGVADNAYVQDDTPANETVYRAQFKFTWNNLTFAGPNNNGPQTNHAIFKAWDLEGVDNIRKQHIVVSLRIGLDGLRKLAIRGSNNVTGTALFQELSLPPATAGFPVTVLVQFDQATDTVQICRKRSEPTAVFSCKSVAVDTGTANVDMINLGVTGAADTTSTGTFYIDSFESYRTLTTP